MTISEFITAFGLGSIVSVIVQSWLAQRADTAKRMFQEKKECYVGLLEARNRCRMAPTMQSTQDLELWRLRCELVAPNTIREVLGKTSEQNEAIQIAAYEELKRLFREDLGVAKS